MTTYAAELMNGERRSREDRWNTGLEHLARFIATRGHYRVPARHVDTDGYRLGQWVWVQRVEARIGRLTAIRVAALEAIGFYWDGRAARLDAAVRSVEQFSAEHGVEMTAALLAADIEIESQRVAPRLREAHREGRLSASQIQRLRGSGFSFSATDAYFARPLRALAAYVAEHGHANVPARHITVDGIHLGGWLCRVRRAARAGRLSDDRLARLGELGAVRPASATRRDMRGCDGA